MSEANNSFLSKLTPGFSGADIENLVNHAIIDSVDNDKDYLDKQSFEEARDRVLTGIKLKINKQTLKNILQNAVHESGHTLTCLLDDICKEDLHKVTIVPRGTSKSKSYKLSNDNTQGTKEELISILDVALGGSLAEELYFGNDGKVGEGCSGGDLDRATSIAKQMVKNFGMVQEFGLQTINDSSYVVDHKISEYTRDKLDESINKIITSRSETLKIKLEKKSDVLKRIVENLIKYEELSKKELLEIMEGNFKTDREIKNLEVIKHFEMNSNV